MATSFSHKYYSRLLTYYFSENYIINKSQPSVFEVKRRLMFGVSVSFMCKDHSCFMSYYDLLTVVWTFDTTDHVDTHIH